MEDFMKERPKRTALPEKDQHKLLEEAKTLVLGKLLPDERINKIVLFGSLANGSFGTYEKPSKGRESSDVDILLMVEDEFTVPDGWNKHFECDIYVVYNDGKLSDGTQAQFMVARKSSYEREENQKEAEKWGVPLMLSGSRHKHIMLYQDGR